MKTFDKLGLSEGLLKSVAQLGFEMPTPIQEKAIPMLLKGTRDFVGLAQTGTGKTAAFGLPLLELIDDSEKTTQALVLAPTRELSLQIVGDLENFSEHIKNFNIVAVYGGASISEQIRKVRRGAHIVVATPGRLLDMIDREAVDLSNVKYVVLDEADEMLNMGFKEDLDKILSYTPDTKKTWLFSATMPSTVKSIMKNYMTDPEELTVGEQNKGNVNIEHFYVVIHEREKYLALKRILDFNPENFTVIFCRTRIDTQRVAEMLMKDNYNADSLHGDLTQQQRDNVMKKFRQRGIQILVATDVAARGIDVENISHVIHMNLPDEMEFYTHRSGRTARAGKKGVSIAMVSPKEVGRVKQIEKSLKSPFTKMKIPTGAEVCQKQLLAFTHKMREVKVNETEIAEFLPAVYDELKDLSKDELIKRFASIEFNRFLDYYRNAPDLNTDSKEGGSERYVTGTRFFINLGKMDGLDKSSLLELLDEYSGVGKKFVGKIDLKGAYSFFEIEKEKADDILKGFTDVDFDGRQVRVEVTGKDSGSGDEGGGERKKPFRKSFGGGKRDFKKSGGSGGYGKRKRY